MPAETDHLRSLIRQGFSVSSLREITNRSLAFLQEPAVKHPASFLFLATISRWVADAWDDQPITPQVAARVTETLRPHFELLIDISDDDADDYIKIVLDAAAIAFRNAIRAGLDCDLI
jgi:hypothetical protein